MLSLWAIRWHVQIDKIHTHKLFSYDSNLVTIMYKTKVK